MSRFDFQPRGPMHEREADIEFFTTEIMDRLRGRNGFPDLAHDDVLTEIRTFLIERLQKPLTEEQQVAMISRLENRVIDRLREIQEECRRFEQGASPES